MADHRYYRVLGEITELPGSEEGLDLCLHHGAVGNVVLRRALTMNWHQVERMVARGLESGLLAEITREGGAEPRPRVGGYGHLQLVEARTPEGAA